MSLTTTKLHLLAQKLNPTQGHEMTFKGEDLETSSEDKVINKLVQIINHKW